jgi:hypothetical protein
MCYQVMTVNGGVSPGIIWLIRSGEKFFLATLSRSIKASDEFNRQNCLDFHLNISNVYLPQTWKN